MIRLVALFSVLVTIPVTAAVGAHRREPALVQLTSTPALFPSFSPQIHDYVVRCRPGTPVRFTAQGAAGTTPFIAGKPGRSLSVALAPGHEIEIDDNTFAGDVSYYVRCLPLDFPQWTESPAASTKGWFIATPSLSLATARSHYVVVFDGNGVPVWWYRARAVPIDAKLLPGPSIAFSSFPATRPEYMIHRLNGTLAGKVVSPDGRIDDHDLQRTAGGDYVFLVYQPKTGVDLSAFGGPSDAIVLEGEIEEVSPTGKLLWSWSTEGHVDLSESARWLPTILRQPVTIPGPDNTPESAYDFFHANAVSVGKKVVLLSLRQTDGVYAIDRATGQILWKLGGTPTPESLTVVGDPDAAAPLGGQHDVRMLPDGTITVFDDGTFLGRAPRAVQYRIDTTARTATLLQQVTDPDVTTSLCCGSARLLGDGDWLISWGGDPVFGEYRPDGTPVFKISFDGVFSYRVVPIAPGRLGIAELRAGMDAMAKH